MSALKCNKNKTLPSHFLVLLKTSKQNKKINLNAFPLLVIFSTFTNVDTYKSVKERYKLILCNISSAHGRHYSGRDIVYP